jgi:folylpolyglutamate synthase
LAVTHAVIQECADTAGAPLAVPPPLSSYTPEGGAPLRLGIAGEHQQLNASLAIQLAAAWEAGNATAAATPGAQRRLALLKQGVLPQEYAAGLAAARWPGRSQVIPDPEFREVAANGPMPNGSSSSSGSSSSRLVFYLDGAHTPESMVTCGDWFATAAAASAEAAGAGGVGVPAGSSSPQQQQAMNGGAAGRRRVLVFNCMKERDPAVLLPQLRATLQQHGVHIDAAVFVPPDSQYSSLTKTSSSGSGDSQQQQQQQVPARDLSWQQHQQQIWAGAGPGGLAGDGQAVTLHEGEGGWVGHPLTGVGVLVVCSHMCYSGACAVHGHADWAAAGACDDIRSHALMPQLSTCVDISMSLQQCGSVLPALLTQLPANPAC